MVNMKKPWTLLTPEEPDTSFLLWVGNRFFAVEDWLRWLGNLSYRAGNWIGTKQKPS